MIKKDTRVKACGIPESFTKASPSYAAAVHNLRNNNRFIGAKATDNILITIQSRDDEERKEVSEMICKLPQYQGAPEVEIDKFNGNSLEKQYFVSMFNQVERKVSDLNWEVNSTINVYWWWSKGVDKALYPPATFDLP